MDEAFWEPKSTFNFFEFVLLGFSRLFDCERENQIFLKVG